MNRDGQGCRDYGMHMQAEAVWGDYGPCGCGAEAGKPCIDRRFKHSKPELTWIAHPGRQNLVGVQP